MSAHMAELLNAARILEESVDRLERAVERRRRKESNSGNSLAQIDMFSHNTGAQASRGEDTPGSSPVSEPVIADTQMSQLRGRIDFLINQAEKILEGQDDMSSRKTASKSDAKANEEQADFNSVRQAVH